MSCQNCNDSSCEACVLNSLLMTACEYKASWTLHEVENDPDFIERFNKSGLSKMEDFINVEKYNITIELFDSYKTRRDLDKKSFVASWYPGQYMELAPNLDKTTPGYIWYILWNNPKAIERAMIALTRHKIEKSYYYTSWINSGNQLTGKFVDKAREVACENLWTLVLEAENRC